jgi:hypothetical protein
VRSLKSFQFEFAAIESHYPVQIRNVELVGAGTAILPNIDRFFASFYD